MVHPDNGSSFSLEKGILTHATAWTDLEGIVLSEMSQTQKGKYCLIPLI